jgi:hypothetical protein
MKKYPPYGVPLVNWSRVPGKTGCGRCGMAVLTYVCVSLWALCRISTICIYRSAETSVRTI